MEDVPAEAVVTAHFEKGTIAGKVVNSYIGPFKTDADGNVTEVGPLAMTKMAGPPAVMAVETAYSAALEKTKSYYADGEQLTLYGEGDAELLVYEKSDATLIGAWDVISYNNGKGAVVSIIATTTVTADFGEDGKVSGSSGVNTYGGEYATEDPDKISIGELATTMMAGPEDAMAQEAAFLVALKSAATYRATVNELELRTADGALAVQMKRP